MRADTAFILMYLGFVPEVDFRASQVALGEVSLLWFSAQPPPTEAEIDAAALPAYKAAAIAANRAEAGRLLATVVPRDDYVDLSLGIYTVASAAPVQSWIGDTRAALHDAKTAINAATTGEEVAAVVVVWPSLPGPLVFDTAEWVETQANAENVRTQADAAITRLGEIIDGTFANNAQRDAAIKDMAGILRGIARHLAKRL